jgi:hypothetical protein
MSPLITALFIVLAVGTVGAFAAFVRDRRRYSGYRDIMREAITFAKTVDGEVFRDANDLVISGEYQQMPLIVRFSHAENTPGLSIHLGAPTTFALAVVPRGQAGFDHMPLVRTPDDAFNMKFEARTDQPTQARMFLTAREAMPALIRLCRSSHHHVSIGRAAVEFSDLAYPTPEVTRALPALLESAGNLLVALRQMPGSDEVAVEPRQKRRDLILRTTIAVGVLAAIATLMITTHERQKPQQEVAAPLADSGIAPADADAIGTVAHWRVVTPSEYDPIGMAWLRDRGVAPDAHIALDVNGTGDANDSAYLLINDHGQKRAVLLMDGKVAYDARYQKIAAVARVPKSAMAGALPSGTPPAAGDGLLLLRDAEDTKSGFLLFLNGDRIAAAPVADYRTISLQ